MLIKVHKTCINTHVVMWYVCVAEGGVSMLSQCKSLPIKCYEMWLFTCCFICVGLQSEGSSQRTFLATQKKVYTCTKRKDGYLRLWGSAYTKAHQSPEEQDPAIYRCKSAHEAIEHSPQHTQLQALCPDKTIGLMNWKRRWFPVTRQIHFRKKHKNLLSFFHTCQICFPKGRSWSSCQ